MFQICVCEGGVRLDGAGGVMDGWLEMRTWRAEFKFQLGSYNSLMHKYLREGMIPSPLIYGSKSMADCSL